MLTRPRRPAARQALLAVVALAVLAPAGLAITAAPARAVPADPVRNRQAWVLNMLDAPAAWTVTKGAGVTVAVIDSGVNPNVSDLAGSVTTGPDYTGVRTPPSNPHWGVHGTWMASLIAGHGHDGGSSGILGVAPEAKVLSIRVITDPGDPGYRRYQHEPTSSVQRSLAAAIRYAVRHRVSVINMSVGYGEASQPVRSALQYAYDHNVVVLASAGNSGRRAASQAPYSFPADYPGVISVAAVDQAGAAARFSSDNLSVQLAAPGVDVPAQGRDGAYWLVSGTSPACALTAGVAALIKAAYPRLSAPQVAIALTTTTRNRPPGGTTRMSGSARWTRPRPWPRPGGSAPSRPPRDWRPPRTSVAGRPRYPLLRLQARARRAHRLHRACARLAGSGRHRAGPARQAAQAPHPARRRMTGSRISRTGRGGSPRRW